MKYGVDEDVCTGDHACIRLSGCPTLTLKDSPDPLRVDAVLDGDRPQAGQQLLEQRPPPEIVDDQLVFDQRSVGDSAHRFRRSQPALRQETAGDRTVAE